MLQGNKITITLSADALVRLLGGEEGSELLRSRIAEDALEAARNQAVIEVRKAVTANVVLTKDQRESIAIAVEEVADRYMKEQMGPHYNLMVFVHNEIDRRLDLARSMMDDYVSTDISPKIDELIRERLPVILEEVNLRAARRRRKEDGKEVREEGGGTAG